MEQNRQEGKNTRLDIVVKLKDTHTHTILGVSKDKKEQASEQQNRNKRGMYNFKVSRRECSIE